MSIPRVSLWQGARPDQACMRVCVQALNIPLVAPSLGGVETLITRPVTTTHVGMSPAELQVIYMFPDPCIH